MSHDRGCDWIRCHPACQHWTPPLNGCEDCHRLNRIITTCRMSMKFTTEGSVTFTLAKATEKLAEHCEQAHGDAQAVA